MAGRKKKRDYRIGSARIDTIFQIGKLKLLGAKVEDIANALGISEKTVDRYWEEFKALAVHFLTNKEEITASIVGNLQLVLKSAWALYADADNTSAGVGALKTVLEAVRLLIEISGLKKETVKHEVGDSFQDMFTDEDLKEAVKILLEDRGNGSK